MSIAILRESLTAWDLLALGIDALVIALGLGLIGWAIWTYRSPRVSVMNARNETRRARLAGAGEKSRPIPSNRSALTRAHLAAVVSLTERRR